MLDVQKIRKDFPILDIDVHPGVPLVYLDSGASSQKPTAVIEAVDTYYRTYNANVHRGIHRLSDEATNAYEGARDRIAKFINARESAECIYVRNATEGFNLVASVWGRQNLRAGDEILLTEMEHHANIVPWQIVAEQTGAIIKWLPITDDYRLDLDKLPELLTEKTKVFAFTAMSNVLGTVNPVKELVAKAHAVGAITVVDGAQSVPHSKVDVQDLDCDFMPFSSHKMVGPTGIGMLYGKRELLDAMPPYMGGGDMILRVTFEGSTYNELPYKFEAGTPSIAQGIGFGAAVEYLENVGIENIHAHEQMLTAYGLEALSSVSGLSIIGPQEAHDRGGVLSFEIDGLHPHDIAQLLDQDGIAVRAGHHCAMPLHRKLSINATARASVYLYTTTEEIDKLVQSLNSARKLFGL